MDIFGKLDIIKVPVYNSIEYTNRGFTQCNNYLKFYKEQRVIFGKGHFFKKVRKRACSHIKHQLLIKQ